ncbi:MAG: NRDE family protein [Balneolaceae bacterium]|nr:NRDE family protein [Balneolaceae bacterium]
MCLTVFAFQTDNQYPLIFATNRDEFYDRPAEPATFWYDHPKLLAGRDLKAGGTWLGITTDHRFAAITNYRDINNIKENAPSRGDIVSDYLTSDMTAPEFIKELRKDAELYNGFNLIAGTTTELWYYTNVKDEMKRIKPGIHTLSNAFLDTPWPKTEKAREGFTDLMRDEGKGEIPRTELFSILQDQEKFPDEKLPSTGLSPEMERLVSSIFITSDTYGTRCSTVIKADPAPQGITSFTETTYIKGTAEVDSTVSYQF